MLTYSIEYLETINLKLEKLYNRLEKVDEEIEETNTFNFISIKNYLNDIITNIYKINEILDRVEINPRLESNIINALKEW